jgi:hypothetical protein
MDEAEATRNLISWLHADPRADPDQARRLLAKLLRTTRPLGRLDPLDRGLRFALGDLFDPDLSNEQGCYLAIERVRGNPKIKRVNHWDVAAHIWQATRGGTPSHIAVGKAAKKFRCHKKTAQKAWRIYEPLFDKYPELATPGVPPKSQK